MNDSEYTMTSPLSSLARTSGPLLGITILWHPVLERVGEQFIGPAGEGAIALGRFVPLFRKLGGDGLALGDRGIARDPVNIRRDGMDGVEITVPQSRMAVEVNGRPIASAVYLKREQIDAGVVLRLGGHVLVCIHWMHSLPKANTTNGLLGVSSASIRVRDLIAQVAATNLAVLLLGETGTGKEVAAQAIHAASKRAGGPLVSVNMAALNESLAAADLFGAVKGAYTGLQYAREGFFAEADSGTLFLDEIGDTPTSIQPMLLRVLETGEYRPLGARLSQKSAARLIAATDQDLDARGFNQPLLRRLEAFVIRIPPLRERREDIGILIIHCLHQWSLQSEESIALPSCLVNEMCNYDWPGNIRQLANVVRQISIALRAGDHAPSLDAMVRSPRVRQTSAAVLYEVNESLTDYASDRPPSSATRNEARTKTRKPRLSEVSDESVVAAMESSDWRIRSAAQSLGISRPSLYKLLDAHPEIRRAESIPREEIRRALEEHAGDFRKCASSLKTPSEALRRYLRTIGTGG